MRLALKLAIGFVAAILPVIAVSAGFRVRGEVANSEADLHSADRLLADALAGAAQAVWRSDGAAAAERYVRAAARGQNAVVVRWVSDDNAACADSAACTAAAVAAPGGGRAAIEVLRPAAQEKSFVRHAIRHAAAAAAAVIALCGTLALGLGGVLVARPVSRMIAQMRRIAGGDLSMRLRPVVRDELGELAAELDVTCDRLAEARDRVEAATGARIAALEQVRHSDRLATVGKLASGIAHELGTPLNVISGHAQLIAAAHPAGTREHEYAAIVIDQTQRVAAVIRQLLDFARRGASHQTPHPVAPILERSLALIAPLAAERTIALASELVPEPITGDVDPGQLQQAITNLVVNALQALRRDGKVCVQLAREVDHARIDVSDDGPGISEAVLPHVFDPFFTTKQVGEGTGLGLAVAHGIVADHGGRIEVTSTQGAGARFSIWLPLSHRKDAS